MIGLDTNVLLRHLAQDDPQQSPQALQLLEDADERQERVYLNVLVLAETVWSLEGKRYGLQRQEIAEILEQLLTTSAFEIQHRSQVQATLQDYRKGKAGFTDYLIGHLNPMSNCRTTVTFDRELAKADGFQAVG